MLIEQIDVVGFEPLEGGFGHLTYVLRAAVESIRGNAVLESEFRGDYYLVANRRERLADYLFVEMRTVGFRSIEEGDAAFVRGADDFDCVFFLRGGAEAKAQSHAAEAECGDFKIAVA
jgi:hypothetical protein